MKTKLIALTGVLGAIAAILMIFDFPLPFAPGFMKMDFSDLPELFAALFVSPMAGCLVALVKVLLNFVLNGTSTAGIGELSNLLGSCIFVLSSSFLYKKKACKKNLIIGLVIGSLVVSFSYVLINAFIMFPVYAKAYGMPMEAIISAAKAVNPLVKDNFTMMLFSILPFNLVKYTLVSLITAWLYEKTKLPLKNIL